jgi:hypothetical protein
VSDPVPPRPHPAHARLEPFVGRWRTRGHVLEGNAEIVGTDSYEWLPGGHFLLHRVDVRIGGERVEALEVIGWDMERGEYFMHAYDSHGVHGTHRASVRDGTWTFEGDDERFTGSFGERSTTLSGRWERREGGEWIPWMDIHLTKTT